MSVLRLIVVLLLAFCSVTTHAAAVSAYSPKFGQAISSLIGQKLTKRGFAISDPRTVATVAGVGTAVTGAASALAVGATWPTLLTRLGISVISSTASQLIIDKAIDWSWGDGDQAKISGADLTVEPAKTAFPTGFSTQFNDIGAGNFKYYWNATNSSWRYLAAVQTAPTNYYPLCVSSPGSTTASLPCPDTLNGYWTKSNVQYVDGKKDQAIYEWVPATGTKIVPAYIPAFKPTADVVKDIPQSAVDSELTGKQIAAAANALWRSAALQGDYAGLPWAANDPITEADVSGWKLANPSAAPRLRDYIAPAIDSATGKTSISGQVSDTTSNPGAGGVKVDFGSDPGIPAPSLESSPTGIEIFNPVRQAVSPWANFNLGNHAAQCPTASFTVLGRAYVIDAHCEIYAGASGLIAGAMIAFWTVVAMLIILSA